MPCDVRICGISEAAKPVQIALQDCRLEEAKSGVLIPSACWRWPVLCALVLCALVSP